MSAAQAEADRSDFQLMVKKVVPYTFPFCSVETASRPHGVYSRAPFDQTVSLRAARWRQARTWVWSIWTTSSGRLAVYSPGVTVNHPRPKVHDVRAPARVSYSSMPACTPNAWRRAFMCQAQRSDLALSALTH